MQPRRRPRADGRAAALAHYFLPPGRIAPHVATCPHPPPPGQPPTSPRQPLVSARCSLDVVDHLDRDWQLLG